MAASVTSLGPPTGGPGNSAQCVGFAVSATTRRGVCINKEPLSGNTLCHKVGALHARGIALVPKYCYMYEEDVRCTRDSGSSVRADKLARARCCTCTLHVEQSSCMRTWISLIVAVLLLLHNSLSCTVKWRPVYSSVSSALLLKVASRMGSYCIPSLQRFFQYESRDLGM